MYLGDGLELVLLVHQLIFKPVNLKKRRCECDLCLYDLYISC